MNSNLTGTTVEEILQANNNKIRFYVFETERFMNSDLESLDLNVRSFHCLRRVGHRTVGDLVNSVSCAADLKSIRNCGDKSVNEILFKLFLFNYECLSPELKKSSMNRLKEMNRLSCV
ncbi:MAG: hypothetical protein ILP10_07675 [Lachnospiraceae bacterium]|nr:hypothetical protein [Lachnospiraceae bacterium]